jgi:predicted phosphodiesterase
MRTALLSDIHGNLTAFQAVLADLADAKIDQIVYLGDAATLGPEPRAVVQQLQALACPCVLGNHEAYMLNLAQFLQEEHADWAKATIAWGVAQCSAAELAFLRTFQPLLQLPLDPAQPQQQLRCVHGSTRSYNEMILATTPPAELDQLVGEGEVAVVACGHTHVQMMRRHRAQLVINPGSVGSPMLEMPFSGAPRLLPWAEYAIIDAEGPALRVELRQVRYDVAAAKRVAQQSGLPSAAAWIEQWG